MLKTKLNNLREPEAQSFLEELLEQIQKPDKEVLKESAFRWSKVAKPLNSLGILEEDIMQIAGIAGTADVSLAKKALIIMCADNGVVAEGVSQTGQEVTAVVTANLTRGDSCACLMAKQAGVDVYPVDIGVACPIGETGKKHPLINRKIRFGTADFLKERAMTRAETVKALLTGISMVEELKQKNYKIIATGEMGIGNTTTSSAVVSVLLGETPERMTGKGAGLSGAGLERKIQVIKEGILKHCPDKNDGIDVLSKVGGLDLAGLAGVFLGGAIYHIPVVIDGFISAAAAAAAAVIHETATDYMMASHVSAEPAGRLVLDFLGKKPVIWADMCLGEGTGAVALMPLLDMALAVYRDMSTFSEIKIDDYEEL